MAIAWRQDINQRVLTGTYQEQPNPADDPFQPEVGIAKNRLRSSFVADRVGWEQHFTTAERASLLDKFYRDDLKGGTLPFVRIDPPSGLLKTFKFAERPQLSDVRGVNGYFRAILSFHRLS